MRTEIIMPYRINKTFEIESGHFLTKNPGKCRYPHGHSRKIELILESELLDQNDMVCDFSLLKIALTDFINSLDHSICINIEDPMYKVFKDAYGDRVIGLLNIDPTTEVIAKIIFDKAKVILEEYSERKDQLYSFGKGVRLVRVRVWETSSTWAEYGD